MKRLYSRTLKSSKYGNTQKFFFDAEEKGGLFKTYNEVENRFFNV